jgi:biotin synthase
MNLDWDDIRARGVQGIGISEEEAQAVLALTDSADVAQLLTTTEAIRRHHKGDAINTCGISNAKSGACPEKCNFCSQSAHFKTEAPRYKTKSADTIAAEARDAFARGVREFSVVMSGRAVDAEADLLVLEDTFARIRAETGMQTCASLGLMDRAGLERLQKAGLQSFHHNLETARSYHDQIVESHSYDDEVASIKAAKDLGMYVCSGGIFGMGETRNQRVELALDLRELNVDSVPVNFLNPRPGTPLAERHDLTPLDSLLIVAMLRLVLPTKDLLVCGGREVNLQEEQPRMFQAGANGLMLGNYLTTPGPSVDRDLKLMADQGLTVRAPPHRPHPPSVPPEVRSAGTDMAGLEGKNLLVAPAK